MKKKQKLELTWIGKEDQPKLEPRILIEDPEKSYGDPNSENMLIYGDNLLALKALEQHFAGRIKCIYIDPPFNTGQAFEHYEDGLEHSIWLNMMRDRIVMLKRLLHKEGSLWVHCDDSEQAYLKVLMDEVFGRGNFVATLVWQKRTSPDARLGLSTAHDYVLVYGLQGDKTHRFFNHLPLSNEQKRSSRNPDNDPRGPWASIDFSAQGYRPNQMYEIVTPAGVKYKPPANRCWANVESVFQDLIADNRIWFGEHGRNRPRIKKFLAESEGLRCWTWWSNNEVGHNQEAKKETNVVFGMDNPFETPKPERLIARVIHVATLPGEIILDSFLGSGTTAAVAHKMGRRYIGVELGEHCHTHCLPRLKQVADGTDQGGISKAVGWKGGGGFKYFYLAPSLLRQDRYENWVIDERYNANMLAAAMAKHEGFRYSPDEQVYWKQGQSTEKDFIFTTTQIVTVELIDKISAEMQPEESLLICCKTFQKECEDRHPHITVRKIPGMLLGRCEFGMDDYSLNIITMPEDPDAPEFVPVGPQQTEPKSKTKKEKPKQSKQRKLF